MKIKLTLLLVIICITSYSQKINKQDSLKLVSTWQKTTKYILANDTFKLRALCLDTIACGLCGYRNDTIVDDVKSINDFLQNGLIKLRSNQKLWAIVANSVPIYAKSGYMFIQGHKEITYEVIYTYHEPNELAKKHEGVQVVFDFVLTQGNYKLASISTVP